MKTLPVRFRRQVPVGPYIVDFMCSAARLVVEIDGSQHYQPDDLVRDRIRGEWLAKRDYEVLRFTNLDVRQNIDGVIAAIIAAVEVRAPVPPPETG